MKHLGDITRLNGAEIEPVDVITGGSPCQDLSLAGKQAGLSGDRSGLFHEQMRLVREMREATGGMYPRFMVWENVPGALSTNKGADFREVLNECVKVVEEAPYVPMPEKGGWPKAGVLYDEMGRWSIAWRIHDAQFWGVPQRRRRIALVCDFRGMRAPEVLFEREGVRGDTDACNTQGERIADTSTGSIEEPDKIWDARGNGRLSATLTGDHDNRITDYTNVVVQKEESYSINGDAHESGVSVMSEVSHALKATTKESVFVKQSSDDVAPSFPTEERNPEQSYPCICIGNGQAHVTEHYTEEVSQTLNCMHDPMTILEPCAYQLVGVNSNSMKSSNPNSGCYETEQAGTITTNGCVPNNQGGTCIVERRVYDARGNENGSTAATVTGDHESRITDYTNVVTYGIDDVRAGTYPHTVMADCSPALISHSAPTYSVGNGQVHVATHVTKELAQTLNCMHEPMHIATPREAGRYVVRRLTPLECTRLQGYPDGWVDIGDWIDSKGKKRKEADAPKYKALGNSIALPFWKWLLARIYAECEAESFDPALGSLFDGIGGFPLSWPGRTAWSSEIEEFPLAVLRARFGKEQA